MRSQIIYHCVLETNEFSPASFDYKWIVGLRRRTIRRRYEQKPFGKEIKETRGGLEIESANMINIQNTIQSCGVKKYTGLKEKIEEKTQKKE